MGSNGNENTGKQNDATRNLIEETLWIAGLFQHKVGFVSSGLVVV